MVTAVSGEAMVNAIELAGLKKQIDEKQAEMAAQIELMKSATEFSETLRLSRIVTSLESEIDRLSKRYAKFTGQEVPDEKGRKAQELKEKVAAAVATDSSLMSLVREIWALQAERKLNSIVLGVDPEHPSDSFTISLEGGFVNRTKGSTASGGSRKAQARWIDPDDAEESLSTKQIVQRFGADFGQTKPWDEMTPEERETIRNAAVAGLNLQPVGTDEQDSD